MPATSAVLYYPAGVSSDNYGNLCIADAGGNVIRKVDASGNMSTIAGTGSAGYSGDNGPALSAKLGDVKGVAVDDAGNIYIPDAYYSVIRKVDTSGITTGRKDGRIHGQRKLQ